MKKEDRRPAVHKAGCQEQSTTSALLISCACWKLSLLNPSDGADVASDGESRRNSRVRARENMTSIKRHSLVCECVCASSAYL